MQGAISPRAELLSDYATFCRSRTLDGYVARADYYAMDDGRWRSPPSWLCCFVATRATKIRTSHHADSCVTLVRPLALSAGCWRIAAPERQAVSSSQHDARATIMFSVFGILFFCLMFSFFFSRPLSRVSVGWTLALDDFVRAYDAGAAPGARNETLELARDALDDMLPVKLEARPTARRPRRRREGRGGSEGGRVRRRGQGRRGSEGGGRVRPRAARASISSSPKRERKERAASDRVRVLVGRIVASAASSRRPPGHADLERTQRRVASGEAARRHSGDSTSARR